MGRRKRGLASELDRWVRERSTYGGWRPGYPARRRPGRRDLNIGLCMEMSDPIPLFANLSRQTAPSCSYYDRFISAATRGLPLYETRTCFRQVLSNLLSPDLF